MKSAVILAAGEGTRAWPFSGIRQKVTAPVMHVPMVRRLALDLIGLGVEEVVVVVGRRAEAVRGCLADLDGVRFVEQGEPKGTADAALAGVNEVSADTVLVCYGDIVTSRASLEVVADAFKAGGVGAVLLTAECPEGLTASRVTVESGPDGLVTGIWGRGTTDRPRFGGVAAARTEALKRYLLRNPGIMENTGVGSMPPVEGDLAYSFELMRQDGTEVLAAAAKDYFVDVDMPWHIVEANKQAAQHAIDSLDKTVISEGATIHDGADIAPDARLWLGPGAHIGNGCHIEGTVILGAGARVINGAIVGGNTVLGDHTRCENYCRVGGGSVLGPRCVVSHCAEFSGVTFDAVYLYHYCCLTALIGTHVDIGAATVCGTWRFDDRVKTHDIHGRKVIPECHGACTFIGDYCRTGVNAVFMPGVKVGYYSCIGGGAIVYDDVPERTMLLPKQEHITKPWGPEKYDW